MFKLAGLYVNIKANADALNGQLDGVRNHLGVMGTAIGTAAGNLAASAIAGASSALAGFFARGISGAISLKDTVSATNAIFGDSAGIITGWADEMAAKFGTVKTEAINAAQGFGASFKAAGTGADEAARLGTQLAKLGMDFASFKGTTNAEAFTALTAALRGEFDPLERYNIMLSAAAIEQEALSLGLIKSAKEMDEAAKKQATLSLIMKKSVDMQGDLERTANDSGNSWRKLTGTIENLAVEMGTALEPAINSLIASGNAVLEQLRPAFDGLKASFESFSSTVVEATGTIAVAWRNLPDIWDMTVLKATEMGTNLIEIIKVIPANLAIVGEWIANNWVELIADGVNAVGAVFTNLHDNIYRLSLAIIDFLSDPTKGFEFEWKPLLDGFAATADALPELARPALVSLQSEIDEAAGRIADRESKRASDLADRQKKAAAPGKKAAADAGKKEKDFHSEVMSGSEFALKMRASIYEQGDDTKKRQLAAAEATAKNTATMAEKLNRPPVAVLG